MAQTGQPTDGGAAQSQGVSALGPELTPIERFASYAWGSAMLSLSALALVQVSWKAKRAISSWDTI